MSVAADRNRFAPSKASFLNAVLLLVVLSGACIAEDKSVNRKFSVQDSIEMTRVRNFDGDGAANPVAGTALFAPDGRQFLLWTERGDLPSNRRVQDLLLFSSAEVTRFAASCQLSSQPRPRKLVEVAATTDWAGLADVRWLSNTAVGFISEDEHGRKQAYIVDSETGSQSKLTDSPTDVRAFAEVTDRVAFLAVAPEGGVASDLAGRSLSDTIDPEHLSDQRFPRLNLFQQSAGRTWAERVSINTPRLLEIFHRLWLSPSGRFALMLYPSVDAPVEWSRYRYDYSDLFGYTAEKRQNDPESADLTRRVRYVVVDLRDGEVRPLVDGPFGWVANGAPPDAIWENDETVIVANTFLPPDKNGRDPQSVRLRHPAVAEVNIVSGQVVPITWEPGHWRAAGLDDSDAAGPVLEMHYDVASRQLALLRRSRFPLSAVDYTHSRILTESYEHLSGGGWRLRGGRPVSPELDVRVRQSLNERPRVYIRATSCRREAELLDPNPRMDQYELGRTTEVQWVDANGIEWRGALVVPPNFRPSSRYPLVVQTHGYRPDEFLVDGPAEMTTAFAAQPLASSGFVVLQVGDSRQAAEVPDQEAARYAEGMRAGISKLVNDGIADPSAVGVIAFSWTGLHLMKLLAQHDGLIRAATFADTLQTGYVSYLLMLNGDPEFLAEWTHAMGTPEFGHIDDWMARNPLYQLRNSTAAIRIEALSRESLAFDWEFLSVLRLAHRAVNMVYIPDASHVILQPRERMASQGGNVDWFRFWLQGYEDPDPVKKAQYREWHKLRDHQATSTGDHTSTIP